MNRHYIIIRTLLLLSSVLLLTNAYISFPLADPVKKRYQIRPESKLFLKGTTNVNSFTCDCTDHYPPQFLEVESQGTYARFQKAGIRISTRDFNCHNRKIEADLEKALHADQYPHIGVDLMESWQNTQGTSGDSKDWFSVKAKVKITITNVSKQHQILGKARKIGNNRFQLIGEKDIQMSEFGIEPPTAMFGMIKVNDWITFHFDLIVEVEDNQATENM